MAGMFVGRNRQDFLKGVAKAGPYRDLTELNRPLAKLAAKCSVDLRNEMGIDLPRAKGAYLEGAPEEIWDGGYVLEFKSDGIRASLQTGATVVDGELTECFKQNGEYDKDTQKRVKNGDFVGYTAWGCMTWRGRDVRSVSEEERYALAEKVVKRLGRKKIRLMPRFRATKSCLYGVWKVGKEGAIAKKLGVGIPNQRTNPNWWKLKGDKWRTVDGFVTGVTQAKEGGSGVEGIEPKLIDRAAGFEVSMVSEDGCKIVKVGTLENLPDEAKERGWLHFDEFEKKVVEMQVSGWDGEWFRFCRFVKWRDDKTPGDCRLEEQVGKIDVRKAKVQRVR